MTSNSTSVPTPKITALDILRNVGASLLIAFLGYWIPVIADQFYSPTEIRYHRVSLGPLSGYLFSIQNYSRHPIEELAIFLDAPNGIGAVYQDGSVAIDVAAFSHPAMIKLKNVAPSTEATLFVTLDSDLADAQVRASSNARITTFENTKYVQRQLWSLPTFLSSTLTALLYLSLGLYIASQRRHMAFEASTLRVELAQLKENAERIKAEADKKIDNIEWRMMRARVHMVRLITRLNEEVSVWRKFFRSIYTTLFGSKSEAESALELILKLSGVHVSKRLRDYSDAEFIDILERADRSRSGGDLEDENTSQSSEELKLR